MACIEWPVTGEITQGFGEPQPWGGTHSGIDIAAPEGTPVLAPFWGTVELVRTGSRACTDPANLIGCDWSGGGYGNYIDIRTESGWLLRTAHHDSILVTPGQVVERGQQIATNGMTGVATGPHVHFEIRRPDGTPVDPYPYLTCTQELPGGPPPPPEPTDTRLEVSLCAATVCSRTGQHLEVTTGPGRYAMWAGVSNAGGVQAHHITILLNGSALTTDLALDSGGSWMREFQVDLRQITQWERLDAWAMNAPRVATELALHPSSPVPPPPAPQGLPVLGLVAVTGIVAIALTRPTAPKVAVYGKKRLVVIKKKGK